MFRIREKYCPQIAACKYPYKCIEGHCRLPCFNSDDCPNKFKCGLDGFCSDGDFLDRQKKAARRYAYQASPQVQVAKLMDGSTAEVNKADYVVPQPEIYSVAPNTKPKAYPYCPLIANCQAPYKCIDDHCRIPCSKDNECPNKWQCGYNGVCIDGDYLDRQKEAAYAYDHDHSFTSNISVRHGIFEKASPTELAVSQPVIDFIPTNNMMAGFKSDTSGPNHLFMITIALVPIVALCLIAGFFIAKGCTKSSSKEQS